ncbi:WD40-repeat-containing domain protein [Colletotrichum navitas]|uniref:WD40-repeat-containing domain protein n=1 Tax=Colletotrichum navitas TaxID=681940 RepID=A0AAD8V705_9PEZI|nr:WD40-repeat-containing domain protein [Colletotrichum navitas]KAK1595384.1 WD40-repeat-containing domain protein [Colletotrichum navitas]
MGDDGSGSSRTGARSELHGTGIQHSGSGNFSAHNIYIGATSDADANFLRDLRVTDPRDDKARIERTKGGLLRDSYHWVLDHDDFRRWRDSEQSRLLWIKGDPGKGKTMLLCGIVDELEKLPARTLSCFFCQATEPHLNNATSVVRGLIYQIFDQHPYLIGRVRKKYDHAGKSLFEDTNSWDALSKMLFSVLGELSLQKTYLVIDALDECEGNLNQLLHLIVQVSSSSCAKLIVSSRNWPDIEDALADATQKIRLCLELNEESISAAVGNYIKYKVDQLVRSKKYDRETRDAVQQHLTSNANDTFLWVALVCQELADPKVRKWHTRGKLLSFPPGLDALYARMMDRVFNSDDADICREVLGLVSVTHRPLSLVELASFADSLEDYAEDAASLEEIVATCGSLLTLRNGVVYFVHQSAKDFLLKNESRIHPDGVAREHRTIALKSIKVMSRTLQRDIYNLRAPGFSVIDVKPLDPDPLAPARYSCVYWVYHFADGAPSGQEQDSGLVYAFLKQHYLHWLEALSLLGSISEGILQVSKLAHLPEASLDLHTLAWDGLRFIRTHRESIANYPLQVYASALIFTPMRSFVRELFRHEEPAWLVVKPDMEDEWNSCLQTFEGHKDVVALVAFSGNSKQLVSASADCTIKTWDLTTGQCLQTLEGHTEAVDLVAFSGDSKQLVSASYDCIVKIWDLTTGQCLQTLDGHTEAVNSVAFLGDSKQLVSASDDYTIKTWDLTTGQCLQTLEGHTDAVSSVAFSGNSKQLVLASYNYTIKTWDLTTGQCLQTLEGHTAAISLVAFLGDSKQLVSALYDCIIKTWDLTTGQCLQTLEGHTGVVTLFAFSGDSMRLASASQDSTIKIWDIAGQCLQTLTGHTGDVTSVAFSGDSIQLASGLWDSTIKIWDTTGQSLQTLKDHSDEVTLIVSSYDGTQLVSASYDCTIKTWDLATGQCLQTLEGHTKAVESVAFSGDSKQLASVAWDRTVKVWDIVTGQCLQTVGLLSWCADEDVRFSTSGAQLYIGEEVIDLKSPCTTSTTQQPLAAVAAETPQLHGYKISDDGVWITRNSVGLLWLPSEYRSHLSWERAVAGSTVAIGCRSGRVLLFRFSESEQGI